MTVPKLLATILCFAVIAGCTSAGSRDDEYDGDADVASEDEDGVDPDLAGDELAIEGEGGGAASLEVVDLRYVSSQHGGTIVIRTNAKAQYRLREVPDQRQIVVEVAGATLPERLKRPYITREFNQAVSAINAYQEAGSSTARFVIQMRYDDRLRVEQRGTEIFLAPERSASGESIALESSEIGDDSRNLPRSYGGGSSYVRDGLPADGVSLDDLNYTTMRFYGKPISIEVRDTPVRDVINFISEQSGANLVVSDEVKGNVTLKLKQIPWDQALLLVMKSKQLGYVRQGNVLRIAPLSLLQSETETARKVIEAQRAAEPLRVRVVPVSYADVVKLAVQVKEFLSARGKVVPDPRTSALIITDIIENIERSTNLIRALDIPPLQVQIEAKVVEAREGFTREIGVNWNLRGAAVSMGGDAEFSSNLAISPTDIADTALNLNVGLGPFDSIGQLDATLGLFESTDEIKVISSPRVVTMNNEVANINQVTKIPFLTTTPPTATTPATTKVEVAEVKLALEVTPQITSDSDVIMAVNIKRDFANPAPAGAAPTIFTREAKTRVMVQNGQTAVIGGIYQNDSGKRDTGVPLLSKIPILGWFFKSRSRVEEKNELLLFLTPRILNSAEGTVKTGEL